MIWVKKKPLDSWIGGTCHTSWDLYVRQDEDSEVPQQINPEMPVMWNCRFSYLPFSTNQIKTGLPVSKNNLKQEIWKLILGIKLCRIVFISLKSDIFFISNVFEIYIFCFHSHIFFFSYYLKTPKGSLYVV